MSRTWERVEPECRRAAVGQPMSRNARDGSLLACYITVVNPPVLERPDGLDARRHVIAVSSVVFLPLCPHQGDDAVIPA